MENMLYTTGGGIILGGLAYNLLVGMTDTRTQYALVLGAVGVTAVTHFFFF